MTKFEVIVQVDTFLFMVGQITGKMFDHPIEKDCVSDLSDPESCRSGPDRKMLQFKI